MNVTEAGQALGKSHHTIWWHIRRGQLKATKVANHRNHLRWEITPQDLERFRHEHSPEEGGLTTAQAAQLLGMRPAAFTRLCTAKELKATPHGERKPGVPYRWSVPVSEVERWAKRQKDRRDHAIQVIKGMAHSRYLSLARQSIYQDLVQEGWTETRMAKRLGVDISTVSHYLKRHGLR